MATIAHLDHAGQAAAAGDHGDTEPGAESLASGRSVDVATAVFSTWVIVGLFVDGWAHNAGKPETFWTPWHAVLYSGFLAGMAWFALDLQRDRRSGTLVRPDPLVIAGFGLFAVGGLADMAWHTIFGIEQDVAALLSPSHLLLMVAGLLLVTSPVRSVLGRPDVTSTWRDFAPTAVGLTLTVAVVAFFTQYASALHAAFPEEFAARSSDAEQIVGLVSVLLTTALLVGALVWTTARWPSPPPGTFTLVFGGTALLMAGLDAFDQLVLVLPVAAGGALADVLVARRYPVRLVAVAVPVAMWSAWFAVYHAVWGLGWEAELTGGTVVFAALTGYGSSLLVTRPAPAPLAADAA
jgi:hypothetical protein